MAICARQIAMRWRVPPPSGTASPSSRSTNGSRTGRRSDQFGMAPRRRESTGRRNEAPWLPLEQLRCLPLPPRSLGRWYALHRLPCWPLPPRLARFGSVQTPEQVPRTASRPTYHQRSLPVPVRQPPQLRPQPRGPRLALMVAPAGSPVAGDRRSCRSISRCRWLCLRNKSRGFRCRKSRSAGRYHLFRSFLRRRFGGGRRPLTRRPGQLGRDADDGIGFAPHFECGAFNHSTTSPDQ